MGMYCEVLALSPEDRDSEAVELALDGDPSVTTAAGVSLEKAWHGIHYLLTGETWGGEGPLAFLLAGGEPLDEDDDEAPRWFTPQEVAQIESALSAISDQAFWSRYNAADFVKQEIYPDIWDEDETDLQDEYVTYFQELKQIVQSAASNGHGLLVSIG